MLTQIILPALFIYIAIKMVLSVPGFLDLSPLELKSGQLYPLTKPECIHVPYSTSLNKIDDTTATSDDK